MTTSGFDKSHLCSTCAIYKSTRSIAGEQFHATHLATVQVTPPIPCPLSPPPPPTDYPTPSVPSPACSVPHPTLFPWHHQSHLHLVPPPSQSHVSFSPPAQHIQDVEHTFMAMIHTKIMDNFLANHSVLIQFAGCKGTVHAKLYDNSICG